MLLIEDSPDDEALLLRALEKGGLEVEHLRVDSGPDLAKALESKTGWDVVISDFNLPSFTAVDALAILKETKLDLPFVIVSGTVGEDVAVAAMRSGAHDYVMKSNLKKLPETLRREVKEAQTRRERRSLEEQVRQAQKMEAVGQLATGLAHDFNNLLTVILSFSQFARDDLPEGHRARDDLKEVVDCACRAAGLTRQLLTFSRRSMFDPQPVDLNSVLESSDKMLRRLVGKHIDYRTVACPERAITSADRGLIEQVVVNLVVNARDAMPEGGKLTVETSTLERDGKPMVMLAVSDTGIGMTPELQARIFEPFFTTKSEGRGTGLGLATVHGIVKQHGGDIAVYSSPGKGTTFKVFMPRSGEAGESLQRAAPLELKSGSETVLVVEDQDPVRAVVQRTLQSTGYHVLEAARGRDALSVVERSKQHVDLVLTDLLLPEMTGQQMVQQLRRLDPKIRVLYMSGYAGGALAHQGVVEPGMSFLQKPFTPDLLVHKVRAALDGGRG